MLWELSEETVQARKRTPFESLFLERPMVGAWEVPVPFQDLFKEILDPSFPFWKGWRTALIRSLYETVREFIFRDDSPEGVSVATCRRMVFERMLVSHTHFFHEDLKVMRQEEIGSVVSCTFVEYNEHICGKDLPVEEHAGHFLAFASLELERVMLPDVQGPNESKEDIRARVREAGEGNKQWDDYIKFYAEDV